ncbi:MAG: type II toxin-antitoxin system HicA family toxin [Nitrospirae bacterium]|nr:type II toxin-antitoxin system HicA family toxin [Nitrospirota bacterium]
MNSKHRKTLKAIFTDPVNGNMEWREIESLLAAIGCRVLEGSGSTVTFEKDGLRITFHRPHPDKASLRYRVKDARNFLTELGVKP